MFAALDAAERVGWARDAADPLSEIRDITEQPAVRDRSLSVYTMNRAHWESRFYDERYWERYFDLLAASRFNRFLIVFGYENGGFLAPPLSLFLQHARLRRRAHERPHARAAAPQSRRAQSPHRTGP